MCLIIPYDDWMDGFDPCQIKNNRRSVLGRTITFFLKIFDEDDRLLAFPISIGRKSFSFDDVEREHCIESSDFNSKCHQKSFYFASMENCGNDSLFHTASTHY